MIPTMLMGWVLVASVVLPDGGRRDVGVEYLTRTACERTAVSMAPVYAPRCVPANDYHDPRPARDVTKSAYPWRNP